LQPLPTTPVSETADVIDLWRFELDGLSAAQDAMFALLNASERARCAGLAFERDRVRFALRRGLLRSLLARYASLEPASLTFDYGPTGKPSLREDPQVAFSLSRAKDRLVVAVARSRRIGIDLVIEDPRLDCTAFANRFFSPGENRALAALSELQRRPSFFFVWAQKEALLKATGLGITQSLAAFEVDVDPRKPARLVRSALPELAVAAWSLREVHVWPGYRAVLAGEGRDLRLRNATSFDL